MKGCSISALFYAVIVRHVLNNGHLRCGWCDWRTEFKILFHLNLRFSRCVHWKDWCWSWNSNTLATSCEELTYWKRPWCWEELGAGGEGDDRGWDGRMASPTPWTWVWVNSGSWWWTGRSGVLQFMGWQSWTWLSNWTELKRCMRLVATMLDDTVVCFWSTFLPADMDPLNTLCVCMSQYLTQWGNEHHKCEMKASPGPPASS